MSDAGIKSACCVPLTFSDGTRGAVGAYRKKSHVFGKRQTNKLAQIANLLPSLYRALKDKVEDDLIETLNQILRVSEDSQPELAMALGDLDKNLREVCNAVSQTYGCMQTSIFLEDPLESPGIFRLIATSWPGRPFRKITYTAKDEGLTGWVLSRGRSVRITRSGKLSARQTGHPARI